MLGLRKGLRRAGPVFALWALLIATPALGQETEAPAPGPETGDPSEPAAAPETDGAKDEAETTADEEGGADSAALEPAEPAADSPAPTEPVASEPVDDETVVLRRDPSADAKHDECVRLFARGQAAQARACFADLKDRAPGTTAALRADVGLSLIDLGNGVSTTAPDSQRGAFLKPGRLELASIAGAYGIWTGVSGGILLGTNSDQYGWGIEPSWIIFGTGAAAVTMGLAYATGGYLLADAMDIHQGNAWSATAGLFWGTAWGIATVAIEGDLFEPDPNWQDETIIFTLLGGGTIGGLTGFGLSLVIDPEIEEVSMMNTGGWLGGFTGLLLGLNIGVWGEVQDVGLLMGSSFMLGNAAGLLLGAGTASLLDLTWGETLLGDLGAVLGIVGGGSVAFAFIVADPAEDAFHAVFPGGDFDKASITTVSVVALGGAAVGVGVTTVGLGLWHQMNGKRLFFPDSLPFQLVPGLPVVMLDRANQPAVMQPVVTAVW